MGERPLAVHRLHSGGVGQDPPRSAELPGRSPRRSGEGETRAFKCSPSMSVAVRCTHSHMSLCKSHTAVRVSLYKSHTTVRVCIYICMCIYTTFRQPKPAPLHRSRSRRRLVRHRQHLFAYMHMTSPSVHASVHAHIGSIGRPFMHLSVHTSDHLPSCGALCITHTHRGRSWQSRTSRAGCGGARGTFG